MSKAFSNCTICGVSIAGVRKVCNVCRASAPRAVLQRAQSLWYWYKLTYVDFGAMIDSQNGRCALCGDPFGTCAKLSPAVDHDHVTSVIRGIIHQTCNRGLGAFDDNPAKLELAAVYLRTASTSRLVDDRWRAGRNKQREWRKRNRPRSRRALSA